MGRTSIYTGIAFALVGLIAGIFVFSQGPTPDLPTFLLLLLCPAAILGALSPTATADSDFMWLIVVINAALYGVIGISLCQLLRLDEE